MPASTGVISSSRTATSSIFDMVTQTAGLVTNTVTSLSQGMDILHSYVKVAHGAATQNLGTKIAAAKERDLMGMALAHSQFQLNLIKEVEKDEQLATLYKMNFAKFSGQELPPSEQD